MKANAIALSALVDYTGINFFFFMFCKLCKEMCQESLISLHIHVPIYAHMHLRIHVLNIQTINYLNHVIFFYTCKWCTDATTVLTRVFFFMM